MRGAESEDGEQLQKHGTAPPGSMAEAKEGGAAAAAKAAAKPEEKKPAAAAKPAATKWKAVTDARTGRTYYYDPVTLETRWEKPLDTEELEKQQSFFAEMEANIRAKLRSNGGLSCDFAEDDLAEFAAGGGGGGRGGGRVPAAPSDVGVDGRAIDRQAATPFPSIQQTADRAAAEGGGGGTRASGGGGSGGGGGGIFDFKRVRTLSSVDDSVMRESDQQFYDSGAASDAVAKRAAARARDEAAAAAGSSSGGGGGGGGSVGEAPPPISLRLAEAKSEQPPDDGDGGGGGSRSRRSSETDASENRGARPRCNTTSTIVVDATMSAPDRDATIQCVCTCFRAHMVEAVAQGRTVGADIRFRIFNEALDTEGAGPLATLGSDVPTVQALAHFMRTIFSRSQMESECIIMSLVYIERLLKQSHMPLNLRNWRPVMMICMVLASKIWDDLSMWNSDFSKVGVGGVRPLARPPPLVRARAHCPFRRSPPFFLSSSLPPSFYVVFFAAPCSLTGQPLLHAAAHQRARAEPAGADPVQRARLCLHLRAVLLPSALHGRQAGAAQRPERDLATGHRGRAQDAAPDGALRLVPGQGGGRRHSAPQQDAGRRRGHLRARAAGGWRLRVYAGDEADSIARSADAAGADLGERIVVPWNEQEWQGHSGGEGVSLLESRGGWRRLWRGGRGWGGGMK